MGMRSEDIDNLGSEAGVRATRPKSYAPEQGAVIHVRPEIYVIQRWLVERGHSEVGGKPDDQSVDRSGQALRAEIERIQKTNGIKPDGHIGRETMDALRQEAPEVAEAIKRLQDDKIGSRPSAMDRIYDASSDAGKEPAAPDQRTRQRPQGSGPACR